MRTRKFIFHFLVITGIALALCTCFSPWQGDKGSITINTGSGRQLVTQDEINNFEYKLTLRSKSQTITKTINGSGSITVEVAPGTYIVDLRAIGATPANYADIVGLPFPNPMLRALGLEADVEVKAGANTVVPLEMHPATEVVSYGQLVRAINRADDTGEKKEYIVIGKGFGIDGGINIGGPNFGDPKHSITFMADEKVKLTRDGLTHTGSLFTIASNSTLVLGKPGTTGSIEIDGSFGNPITDSLIKVNGKLEMYDGVSLVNNKNTSTSNNGGGVYVASGGTFIMEGGTISGNSTGSSSGGGGGVYVQSGDFTMQGNATIVGNTATSNYGGGVCVDGGIFTMRDNSSVSGNIAGSNGGGVYTSSTFIMRGGTISSNKANSNGGGVYVDSGTFCMVTGTVVGTGGYNGLAANIAATSGAALYNNSGQAKYGTYNGSFNPVDNLLSGGATNTDNTIRVVNGELK